MIREMENTRETEPQTMKLGRKSRYEMMKVCGGMATEEVIDLGSI